MNCLINYIKSLFSGEFAKNVAILLSGSTVAQIIPFFVAPVLSRLFTPAEFGALAVYLSVVNILGSIATGRYEFALIIPKEKRDAKHLFVLEIFLVSMTSILSLILLIFFKDIIIAYFKIERITRWLYFVPFSTFLLGIYNLLNYYNTRIKAYKTIATSSIVKSTSKSAVQLGSGFIGFGAGGLVAGEIAAMLFGNFQLLDKVRKDTKGIDIQRKHIFIMLKRFKRFPLFSMWAILLGSISQNISNFFITALFSITQTGFFSHAIRYLTLPINMIGNALSQVLVKQAADALKLKGNAKEEFLAVVKKQFLIAIPSFTLLFLFVEDIFAWYFGEEWRTAGQYAKIMIPYLFFRFIAFPLSSLNLAFEKQLLGLYIQALLFVLSIAIFIYIKHFGLSIIVYLKIQSAVLSGFYFIVIILMYFVACNKLKSKYF